MSESLKELKVLYVEDEETIREAMARMLNRVVGKLYVAKNGKEGLELYMDAGPDMVVSDIRMPVMDGIEMAKHIKEINFETPIIFTTAFGDSDYLKEVIDMGAQGYLIKPIEKKKLMQKLSFIADAVVNSRRKLSYLKLIHALFDSQKDAVVLVDGSGNIQMSNLAYKNLCMRIDCDGIDSICSFIAAIDKKGAFRGSGSKNNLLKYLVQMDGEIVEFDLDGKTQYLELHVRQIDDLHLLEFHDVTAFKNEAKELERESLIDQLTNAYNRKIFKRATAKIAKSGSSMCVIMIDIDHFKRVNDTFGHGVGDEVLKMVAKEIKNNIRSEDYFIRWGGEEFMLLSSTNRDSGYLIAEKIRKAIESIDFERVGKVTVSCGVSCKETKAIDSFDKLVEEADMALYQAKKEGRNKVVCKS